MLKERRILKYTSHEAIKVAKQIIESLGGVNRVEWVIINTPHSMQGKAKIQRKCHGMNFL